MLTNTINMTTSAAATAQSALVLGLGRTGYSVVEYLCARGEQVTAADTRDLAAEDVTVLSRMKKNYPQVNVITGKLPREGLDKFDRVIISPGLARAEVAGLVGDENLIGDIELFAQHTTAPVIAVTGSNGKSTVTMLASVMLQAAGRTVLTGGNIGTPALELLSQPSPDFYVLELSSFQLESTFSLRAAAAAVLNISEDHMDRYRDMAAYINAKARILTGARVCILNRDDPHSAALRDAYPDTVTFGMDADEKHYGVTVTDTGRFLCRGKKQLGDVKKIALHGEQNIANFLAALALVEAVGVAATKAMLDAACNWGGLEHRCEFVADVCGARWINDSKGTNVGATVAALRGFGADGVQNIILIAGGLGKGADFTPLQSPVCAHVRHAILFGQDGDRIAAALDGHTTVTRAHDLADAVTRAAELSQSPSSAPSPSTVILFSPACASFDAFENYHERGIAFKQLVAQLTEPKSSDAPS